MLRANTGTFQKIKVAFDYFDKYSFRARKPKS